MVTTDSWETGPRTCLRVTESRQTEKERQQQRHVTSTRSLGTARLTRSTHVRFRDTRRGDKGLRPDSRGASVLQQTPRNGCVGASREHPGVSQATARRREAAHRRHAHTPEQARRPRPLREPRPPPPPVERARGPGTPPAPPRGALTCAEGSSASPWDRRLSPPRAAAPAGGASAPASLESPITSLQGRRGVAAPEEPRQTPETSDAAARARDAPHAALPVPDRKQFRWRVPISRALSQGPGPAPPWRPPSRRVQALQCACASQSLFRRPRLAGSRSPAPPLPSCSSLLASSSWDLGSARRGCCRGARCAGGETPLAV